MFNITVRSASGDDEAIDVPVLQARHMGDASSSSISKANHPHKKRIISTPQLTGCEAPFSVFSHSLCEAVGPDRTPQTYLLYCQHPGPQPSIPFLAYQMHLRSCKPTEVCVTKVVQGQQQAHCVSSVDFRLIQKARMGGVTSAYYANHILTFPDPKSIPHTGLVAMLVGQNDITKTVVADRILLQAVGGVAKYEPVNGPSFNDIIRPGGNDDCHGCNSVGFSLVPQGTTAINLAVWLPAAVTAAQLYIATYSQ